MCKYFHFFVSLAIVNLTNFILAGGGLISERILLKQGTGAEDGTEPTPAGFG